MIDEQSFFMDKRLLLNGLLFMKVHNSSINTSRKSISGYTLIEITLTITVLLSLIGIMTPGVRGYKRGSDRAMCIMNLQSMQKSVHALGNMYQYNSGDPVPELLGMLIGVDGFFHKTPECPGGGTYSYLNIIPHENQPFMSCSIEDHILFR